MQKEHYIIMAGIGDNKYLFLESEKIEEYKETGNEELLMIVDGDMIRDIANDPAFPLQL